MISKSLLIAFMVLANTNQYVSAEENNDSFTVFCTGNHDSTGTCIDTNADDDSNSLNCTMVPGNIIDCKNESKDQIECILIIATSAQAEFSCRKNRSTSIDEERASYIENLSIEVDSLQKDLSNSEEGPDIEIKTDIFSNPFR